MDKPFSFFVPQSDFTCTRFVLVLQNHLIRTLSRCIYWNSNYISIRCFLELVILQILQSFITLRPALARLRVRVMVFNATFKQYFSYIVAVSFFLVEVTGENHWLVASHCQTLSHDVLSTPSLSGISC
jgi:hypothetical protein